MSAFKFNGETIEPGTKITTSIALPALPNGALISLPVAVLHGKKSGPTAWISAAIHGDEINGTQVIRQLLNVIDPADVSGTLLAVPIVDVYGFDRGSRYLPDRRDLNRCFPGQSDGSLASQLAYIFFTQIVKRCNFGIDLHTGSNMRANHPQVRGAFTDKEFMSLARSFNAPLTVNSESIDGSLRKIAAEHDISYIIYEAGEAGRFDQYAIDIGFKGCQRVLATRGLIKKAPPAENETLMILSTHWLRASRSGIFTTSLKIGERIEKSAELGQISGAFNQDPASLVAPGPCVIIGLLLNPLVEAGDALFHLGMLK